MLKGTVRKLTKDEFCSLAERYEEIKRKYKAARDWQATQDEWAIDSIRYDRIYKKSRVVI